MYSNRRGFLRWIALGLGALVGLLPALTRRRFDRALAQGALLVLEPPSQNL
jgi:cytochrome b6-f complex iron-sulfur subunit